MATQIDSLFNEDQSIDDPYYLMDRIMFIERLGWKYSYKYIIIISEKLQSMAHTHTALIDEFDKEMIQMHAKAMNKLYCSLDINEFNLIFSCISAK